MRKIKGLDGVRALSALGVLLGHAGLPQSWLAGELSRKLYFACFSHTQAVIIFFVLSGYLISLLLKREQQAFGKINYGKFLLRRLLRLVPAYAVYLLVIAVLSWAKVLDVSMLAFGAALSYTYNFLPSTFGSGHTNHLWSLSVEEQFYLFFPWLMRWFSGRRLWWSIGVILVGGVFFTEYVGAVSLPTYSFTHEGTQHDLSDFRLGDLWTLKYWIIPAGLYCLIGCLAGLWSESLRKRRVFWRGRGMPILLLSSALYLHPVVLNINFGGVSKLLQCIGTGLFFIYLHDRQSGLLVRLLSLPPLPYLGRISYGTYVWHGLFIATGSAAWQYWWQGLPWGFVFSYLTAIISYHLIEQPFLQLKERYR